MVLNGIPARPEFLFFENELWGSWLVDLCGCFCRSPLIKCIHSVLSRISVFLFKLHPLHSNAEKSQYPDMKTPGFVFFFLIVSFIRVFAQNPTGRISGSVYLDKDRPAEGATISLLRSKDSFLLKTTLADADGSFEWTAIKPDIYFISVSFSGFSTFYSTNITISENQLNRRLPDVYLKASTGIALERVTVQAQKPFVEKKIDRIVVNPDALITNAGNSVLEVLEKSPGVQVDPNGLVSLRGKQGVLIYVDDKPLVLTGNDLANYLKSIPSSAISTIELMSTPPARYDAQGSAGIINIRFRKNKQKGLNGGLNVAYGQGFYYRTNNSLNFNYRINKVNFFTNFSITRDNSFQDLKLERKYFTPSGIFNTGFNQRSYIKKEGKGMNGRIGLDYYINKKSTLGLIFNGFNNPAVRTTENDSRLSNNLGQTDSLVRADNIRKSRWKNGMVNLNFDHKLDSLGQNLAISLDYIRYNGQIDLDVLNRVNLPDGTPKSNDEIDGDMPAKLTIKTARLDYKLPVKKAGNLEAGLKVSDIETDNTADFYDVAGGTRSVNNDFTNRFIYGETISAAYLNFSREARRFSLQMGLRLENTSLTGNQLGNAVKPDSLFKRTYQSLFPTFYVTYNLDSQAHHVVGLSYGRRILRPNYQDLNPFTSPLDKFTLYEGNPFLQPSFSHDIEISHSYKGIINTWFVFNYTNNVVAETIEQRGNVFYSRPGNIGRGGNYGIAISAGLNIRKWYRLQAHTEVITSWFKDRIYNQQLDVQRSYYMLNFTNQFTISPKWSAECSGFYRTKLYYGQIEIGKIWYMSAGVQKKVMKNQGTIKLALSDMFRTNLPNGIIGSLSNSQASYRSTLDSRVLTLSFGIRFNKGKSLKARENSGSETEKQRVKTG